MSMTLDIVQDIVKHTSIRLYYSVKVTGTDEPTTLDAMDADSTVQYHKQKCIMQLNSLTANLVGNWIFTGVTVHQLLKQMMLQLM